MSYKISRDDYMFTIGYQGNTAIVDGSAKRKYARFSIKELVSQGMFKPALCSALYGEKEEELKVVLELYNEYAVKKLSSVDELKKVFGISKVPHEIVKVDIL